MNIGNVLSLFGEKLDYGTRGSKGLSYSRDNQFKSCPRKFQIENVLGVSERVDTVTFSFGHAVAAGVQSYFLTGDKQQAVIATAFAYTVDWQDEGTASEQRAKKSVWYAINAVCIFMDALEGTEPCALAELRNWELAILADSKPAIELQFRILLEDSYTYEGHIDLVLVHKHTKEFAILELKTTSMQEPADAQYGKSSQALSYSIVLDKAVGHSQASYKVFYLIYSSSKQVWYLKDFVKIAKSRLDWINNLIRTTWIITMYEDASREQGIPYPTNGSSCYDFFRECSYYHTCEMEDASLVTMYGKGNKDTAFNYQDNADFVFTLDEIIHSQIARIDTIPQINLPSTGAGNDRAQLIEL